jgi:hypothetical protein
MEDGRKEDDVVTIVDGPDKPALQWALTYPTRERVRFGIGDDIVKAEIDEMTEQPDGWTFDLKGRLVSGPYKGVPFQGRYSIETRSGTFALSR